MLAQLKRVILASKCKDMPITHVLTSRDAKGTHNLNTIVLRAKFVKTHKRRQRQHKRLYHLTRPPSSKHVHDCLEKCPPMCVCVIDQGGFYKKIVTKSLSRLTSDKTFSLLSLDNPSFSTCSLSFSASIRPLSKSSSPSSC